MPSNIRKFDPNSREYARDYQAGWRASENYTDGTLDRADSRGASDAWYDGYHDSAAGREKWIYREWRRNGCDAGCGYACDGPHKELAAGTMDLEDETISVDDLVEA